MTTSVSKFEARASAILDGLVGLFFLPGCYSVEPVGSARPDATPAPDGRPDAAPDARPDVGPDGPIAPDMPECVEPGDNDRFVPNSNGNSFVWAETTSPDTAYSVKLWKLSRPDEDKPASMPDDQYNGGNGSDIFFLDTRTDYLWEISACSVHGSKPCAPPKECRFTTTAPGLVGWWRFEESSGTTAEDWSGNNNHGMLRGEPERVPSNEIVGNVLRLNLPQIIIGAEDYVFVETDPSLEGMEELTVEAWVKYGVTVEGNVGIVSKFWDDSSSYALRTDEGVPPAITGPTGKINFTTDIEPGNANLHVTSISVNRADDEVWHYLVATYNGLSQFQQIFIDGVLETSSAIGQTGTISNSGRPVCFGATCISMAEVYRFFRGDMDEIAIYERALDPNEILDNCHHLAPTQCP